MRLATAGSGAEAGGFVSLASIPATRDASASIAALACGTAVGGATSPGHPGSQATAITSAAAPATTATTAEKTAALEGHGNDRLGSAPAPAFWVSPDISVASRSMVGGARLARPESGDGSLSSDLSSAIPTVPYCCGRRLPDSACPLRIPVAIELEPGL